MIKNREQLDIVLQAIIAARDSTSGTTAFGKAIRLVRQPKTPIWTIKPMDLLRLLQKLEEEEKIIRLCLPDDQPPSALESEQQIRRDIPPFNHYSSQVAGKMITGFQSTGRGGRLPTYEYPEGAPDFKVIYLRVLDGFDNWYEGYQEKKNRKLEDLDLLPLENIYNFVLDIHDRYQISHKPDITVPLISNKRFEHLLDALLNATRTEEVRFRSDALQYLTEEEVILNFEIRDDGYDDSENAIDLKIDIKKYKTFKTEIEAAYTAKTGKAKPSQEPSLPDKPTDPSEIVYEIKYTKSRGRNAFLS